MTDTRNVYDILEERGFLKQASHPEKIKELLGEEKVAFYIGFDPTADSLHIGHYVALMTMAHMQRAGHRPIILLGGGTAMVGDPSGKTDMRKMLSEEDIKHNVANFKQQMGRLISFEGETGAIVVNNGDWIGDLNFISFMREIGVHFSVNRMLAAECYKQRMEGGLTFFEMSYMLMQSYDFLVLNRRYNCVLEMGGDDQWSNMLGGVDLIRKLERKPAYCLTVSLLTNSEGKKMGKTERGAVWLDKEKLPVYDFYQYWRNIPDADVERCLSLLTFLPIDRIKAMCSEGGAAMNEAKRTLAFTITEQVHGTAEALRAQQAAEALFGGGGSLDNIPTLEMGAAETEASGLRVVDLLVMGGLCKSKSDARRMIEQKSVYVDDTLITDTYATIPAEALKEGALLKKGKKGFVRVVGK